MEGRNSNFHRISMLGSYSHSHSSSCVTISYAIALSTLSVGQPFSSKNNCIDGCWGLSIPLTGTDFEWLGVRT